MKKFTFVLLLIIGITYLEVGATSTIRSDTLAVEVGVGTNEDLKMDNCNLVSGTVNWSQVGEYELKYYDEGKEEYFNRLVRIASKQELETGFNIYKKEMRFVSNGDYIVRDYLYVSNSEYYVVGSIESNDEIIQTDFVQEYGFIKYYQNDRLIWEKVFDEVYSYVESIEQSEVGVICLMAYDNSGHSDIKLIELSKNGKIVREQIFTGDRYEYPNDLQRVGDYLYLLVTSNSNTGDISYQFQDCRFIMYLKVRMSDFKIESSKAFGNDGANDVLDYEYDLITNTFWLFMRASGNNGPLINKDKTYHGDFLIRVDSDLKPILTKNISLNENIHFMYIHYGRVIFVGRTLIQKRNSFNVTIFSDTMTFLNRLTWVYPEDNCNVEPIKIKNMDNDNLFIPFNVYNDGTRTSKFTGTLSLNDTSNPRFINYSGTPFKGGSIYGTKDNSIHVFGFMGEDIILNELINLQAVTVETVNYENINYPIVNLFVNDEYLLEVGRPRSSGVFGHYQSNANYDSPFIKLIIKDEYCVYDKFNLSNNQVYDVGINIKFNGQGYLNDELISENYQINTPGQYCLVVVGHDVRKIINFKVENLSTSHAPKPKILFGYDGSHIDYQSGVSKDIISLTKTSMYFDEEPDIMISIIIATIIGTLTCFIPLKPRRKK